MNPRKTTLPRLSREDWLEESLRILAQEGDRPITVEVLCERLGVSRGSFYWHFKDTEDFHVAVIEHWEKLSTVALRDAVFSLQVSPEERLLKLLEMVTTFQYKDCEVPMRLWAMKEPKTKKVLQRIDSTRYEAVRSLFEEMGFTGDELEMRVQTCVVNHNFMDGLSIDLSKDQAATLRQIQLRHRMLTS